MPPEDVKSERDADINTINAVQEGETIKVSDLSHTQTSRGLKSRHTQMIALGGTIGTGLFLGSGQVLHLGGPAFLLASYILNTLVVYGIVTGTTEFSSYLPVPGSTVAYFANRYVSRSLGFALGWMFWYVCAVTVPAEITAASLVIDYWNPPVNVAIWITIIMVVIIALNCFPVGVYGETEFWFASIKVIGIIGLLFMAVVITSGGGPTGKAIGFSYWNNPGAANEYLYTGDKGRIVSFFATWTTSMFAFVFAPELIIITGGEMQNPRSNMPLAGRRYFYRLIIFYVLGAFFMGLVVPSNDPRLLGGGEGAGASPWAIAAKRAGIKGLDSVINAIILLSAWSAGNAWLYMASRSLYSMAVFGIAPRVFLRCTAGGVPYVALAGTSLFSLLAYMNVSSSSATVFNWFVNLINSSGYISWICCSITYLRFRKATFVQDIHELPYRSIFQPYASYICIIVLVFMMLAAGFTTFLDGHWNTSNFVTSYIAIPMFLLFYFGHMFFADRGAPWAIPSTEVDLQSGLHEIVEEETPSNNKGDKWFTLWRRAFE